jgi:hypothetical protein
LPRFVRWSAVRAPLLRQPSGPFLIPARLLLLIASLIAIALGAFNLGHELHAGDVDRIYTIIAGVVAAIWLVSVLLVFRGVRVGAFIAGAIAFVEFGVTASAHFVSGTAALSAYARHEGLPVAAAVMGLVPACALVFMSAIVSWSHPTGRIRRLDTLALLIAAVLGTILAVLSTTNSLERSDFGAGNPEDFLFIAAITAAAWVVGGFWIARVRRTGAIVIAVATFNVWFSFMALHLSTGGTPTSQIGARSGVAWEAIALAAPTLALASFVMALGILALAVIRPRRRAPAAATVPSSRRAGR